MKTFLMLLILSAAAVAHADDVKTYDLKVKNGHFDPEVISVPKNEKFKLSVSNEGDTAEEFESTELNREKIVAPHGKISIFLGPLAAGEYGFFGDFHADTAKGKIIAK